MVVECPFSKIKLLGKVVMLLLEQSMIVSLNFRFKLQEHLSVQSLSIYDDGKGQVKSA